MAGLAPIAVSVFALFALGAASLVERQACARLDASQEGMRDLRMPNIYATATWMKPGIDSFLENACMQATALRATVDEVRGICTTHPHLMLRAEFFLNNTEFVCSEEGRQAARELPNMECLVDFDLDVGSHQCMEDFFQRGYTSPAFGHAFCTSYSQYQECVESVTTAECGSDAARFIAPMWNLVEANDCY